MAMNVGMGAMKAMMYNAINYLCWQKGKEEVSKVWFTKWLRDTPELYIIKSKLITWNCIEIYSLEDLKKWFTTEYVLALKETEINKLPQEERASRIHNMNEKGVCLACPRGQEIIVPISINEIYVGIPENWLSLTVIKSICTDGMTIPLVVIILANRVIEY